MATKKITVKIDSRAAEVSINKLSASLSALNSNVTLTTKKFQRLEAMIKGACAGVSKSLDPLVRHVKDTIEQLDRLAGRGNKFKFRFNIDSSLIEKLYSTLAKISPLISKIQSGGEDKASKEAAAAAKEALKERKREEKEAAAAAKEALKEQKRQEKEYADWVKAALKDKKRLEKEGEAVAKAAEEREKQALKAKLSLINKVKSAFTLTIKAVKGLATTIVSVLWKVAKATFSGIVGLVKRIFSALTSVKTLIGVVFTGYMVRQFINQLADAEKLFFQMHNTMVMVAGDMDTATKKTEFAIGVAKRYGLSLQASAGEYAKLAAAGKGIISESQVDDLFVAISQATAAMALPMSEAQGIFKAFVDMLSKGTVYSEELKRQLGNRLPGAFAIAARSMGMTVEQLMNALKAGNVLASDLIPRITYAISNWASSAAEGAAMSLQAVENRMKASWQQLLAEFSASGAGSILKDFYIGLNNALETIRTYLKNNVETVKGWFSSLQSAVQRWAGVTDKFGLVDSLITKGLDTLANALPNIINSAVALYNSIANMVKSLTSGTFVTGFTAVASILLSAAVDAFVAGAKIAGKILSSAFGGSILSILKYAAKSVEYYIVSGFKSAAHVYKIYLASMWEPVVKSAGAVSGVINDILYTVIWSVNSIKEGLKSVFINGATLFGNALIEVYNRFASLFNKLWDVLPTANKREYYSGKYWDYKPFEFTKGNLKAFDDWLKESNAKSWAERDLYKAQSDAARDKLLKEAFGSSDAKEVDDLKNSLLDSLKEVQNIIKGGTTVEEARGEELSNILKGISQTFKDQVAEAKRTKPYGVQAPGRFEANKSDNYLRNLEYATYKGLDTAISKWNTFWDEWANIMGRALDGTIDGFASATRSILEGSDSFRNAYLKVIQKTLGDIFESQLSASLRDSIMKAGFRDVLKSGMSDIDKLYSQEREMADQARIREAINKAHKSGEISYTYEQAQRDAAAAGKSLAWDASGGKVYLKDAKKSESTIAINSNTSAIKDLTLGLNSLRDTIQGSTTATASATTQQQAMATQVAQVASSAQSVAQSNATLNSAVVSNTSSNQQLSVAIGASSKQSAGSLGLATASAGTTATTSWGDKISNAASGMVNTLFTTALTGLITYGISSLLSGGDDEGPQYGAGDEEEDGETSLGEYFMASSRRFMGVGANGELISDRPQDITIINGMDPQYANQVVEQGSEAILNVISANASTVKAILG